MFEYVLMPLLFLSLCYFFWDWIKYIVIFIPIAIVAGFLGVVGIKVAIWFLAVVVKSAFQFAGWIVS
jgi:hypothetical protein